MTRRIPAHRRLFTAAGWPLGVALTSWSYLWRTTPMHRHERLGTLEDDAPPPLPSGVSDADLQRCEDGVGPLFRRRYRVRIRDAELDPPRLMACLREDLNAVAPTEFARFIKVGGEEGRMALGDEYVVRMPGPWDGPVRVVAVEPASFRLATLRGHLEAGQIEFRARDEAGLLLEIESWATSGSRLSALLYTHARMSKEIQLHMWTSLLERASRLGGGRRDGAIEIDTRRVDRAPGGRSFPGGRRAERELAGLAGRPLNFEPRDAELAPPAEGWRGDDVRERLPREAPGPPAPGGSWEAARRVVAAYEFPDPSIVRAVYRPDTPLLGRDILLVMRLGALRFHGGVRVDRVEDGTRETDGRAARVWGWSYVTLEGHPEAGRRAYEVWKWLDTGAVEFRTHAVSRSASRNPLVRVAFRVIGRRRQRLFVRRACERAALLTRLELAERAGTPSPGSVGEGLRASPVLPTAAARHRLESSRQTRPG
jgi:uncharacterized protein (UPF0548 family)